MMTPETALERANDMIASIGTLTDGLAQRNAAQTKFYIATLHDLGLLDDVQFADLCAQTDAALHDWEVHQSGQPAPGC